MTPQAMTPQPALHPAWNDPYARGEREFDYPAPQAAPRPAQAEAEAEEDGKKDRDFVLQIVQPALTGLMDGSVSTLAPIFAVAFATHLPFTVFLVGMASALGAGISMAFSEALSDDGDLTGRGKPLIRGLVTGLMTFLSGAGHTLPFLIPNVQLALYVTYGVVTIELFAIAGIRAKFFGTSWWLSIVQVVGGGALVVATSLLLGSA
jgi:VIT1/CCC1 family predicted Fe2+/Mn2+ transporter